MIIGLNILLVVFVVAVLAALAWLVAFALQYDKKTRLNCPNFVFLELDFKQWRIRRIPLGWNPTIAKTQPMFYLNEMLARGWLDINRFFSLLGPAETQNWKAALQYCIQNKTNIEINSVISVDHYQRERSHWTVDFFAPQGDLIRVNIKWVNQLAPAPHRVQLLDKAQLLVQPEPFKLFVAFSLTEARPSATLVASFLDQIRAVVPLKHFRYFTFKNNVVFVVGAWQFAILQKLKNKFITALAKNKTNIVLNNYYDGLAYVEVKHLNGETDFTKVLARLAFGLIKSKLTCAPFHFSTKGIFFNEFEEYKEAINTLHTILNQGQVATASLGVYSMTDQTKTLEYHLPHLSTTNNWLTLILATSNFREKLSALFFRHLMQSCGSQPFMIDINDHDISHHFEHMVAHPQGLYIVNIVTYTKPRQTIELFTLLKNHNIQFGLRILAVSAPLLSLLENAHPSFVILTREFSASIRPETLHANIDKIGLLLMCERLQIMPIFENPDPQLQLTLQNLGSVPKLFFRTPATTWDSTSKLI